MAENITISAVIPASPQALFEAWLSGDEHARMTGGKKATYEQDGSFTAWDGYISGKTLEKSPYTSITQTWRSTEFPPDAPDSELNVQLEPTEGGTLVSLHHNNVPDGQGDAYRKGWDEYYFTPMREHFSSPMTKLKEAGEAIEAAVEEVVDDAAETAQNAMQAVKRAQKSASTAVKKARKAVARAGKSVAKAINRVKTAAAKKTAGKTAGKAAKASAKKVTAKKASAKKAKAPAKRAAAKRKAAPAKKKAKSARRR